MKDRLGKIGIICLTLVIALSSVGFSYAKWSDILTIEGTVNTGFFNDCFSWVVSNDNGAAENVPGYTPVDPGDNGLDPSQAQAKGASCARYDKDVASTTAVMMADAHHITVNLDNAYPCYYPTIFYGIVNGGTVPSKIESIEVDEDASTDDILDDIPELTVRVSGISVGQVIEPGTEVVGDLEIHVEQSAAQSAIYTIKVTIRTTLWCLGGTQGFWKNWDSHNTYTKEEIEEFLIAIDGDSDWLGPTTVEGMGEMLGHKHKCGSVMQCKFLKQYLLTRLDAESGRLDLGTTHNFASLDPDNYLGPGGWGTLSQIISVIEGKHGTSPSHDEFEVMKNVCDALNNLEI